MATLFTLQIVRCAALAAPTIWRLTHMTDAEKFMVRWYRLGRRRCPCRALPRAGARIRY